jgi:proteic killer suppression protein
MIKSFSDNEADLIFHRQHSRKLPPEIQRLALRKLRMIHRATSITDLRVPPANHLEKLSGNRKGQWSIRINNQWRICFDWIDNNAYSVEIVDYH